MEEALKYEGWTYVYGGDSPSTSFDCSGLVQWCYGKAGIALPRTAQEQYNVTPVSYTHLDVYKRQVQDGESLARYLVQEVQLFGEVHPALLNHIDYASIGRELETSENYLFTDNGIFSYR